MRIGRGRGTAKIGQARRLVHAREARAARAEQRGLGAGAVVGRSARQHDVTDAQPAQPRAVRLRPEQVVVEQLVLREVVLPVAAPGDRDVRLGEVRRRPVAGRVHHLDAVGRRQVRRAGSRSPAPSRHARRPGRCARAGSWKSDRRHVPGDREREHAQGDRQRPPAAQRERQHRDRDRRIADAQHVLADRARDRERAEAGDEVDDVHPPERPGALDAPGERDPERAEDQRRQQLLPRERVLARAGEGAPERDLDAGRRRRSSAPAPAGRAAPPSARSRTPASRRVSSRKASGLAASVSAASTAKRHERRAWSAQIASSASAAPSAKGNAAEKTIPAQTTANVRLDQRAVGPHCRETITANASAAVETVATASSRIPKQRRQRVVERAVGDEAVAPRVPEVVPEGEAVVQEERALVGVFGQV